MHQDIYARDPLLYYKSIPVFSNNNDYTVNYEKIAAYHLEVQQQFQQNPWIDEDLWLEMEKSTIDLLRKFSVRGQRILDVGVGMGRVLAHFPELERFGMDISFDYLEEAQRKGIDVCYSLVEDMPYRKEYFDIIVCMDVLEHVLDLNIACTRMLEVLKGDGTLIIRVPYREDLSPYLRQSDLYHYSHLRNFDEHSLQLLFKKVFKCEVLDIVFTGYRASSLKLRDALFVPRNSRIFYYAKIMLKGMLRGTGSILRQMNTNLYENFTKMIYRPTEINMVVKKR